jgi:hypothetical protein
LPFKSATSTMRTLFLACQEYHTLTRNVRMLRTPLKSQASLKNKKIPKNQKLWVRCQTIWCWFPRLSRVTVNPLSLYSLSWTDSEFDRSRDKSYWYIITILPCWHLVRWEACPEPGLLDSSYTFTSNYIAGRPPSKRSNDSESLIRRFGLQHVLLSDLASLADTSHCSLWQTDNTIWSWFLKPPQCSVCALWEGNTWQWADSTLRLHVYFVNLRATNTCLEGGQIASVSSVRFVH